MGSTSRIGLLQDDLKKRIEDFASLKAWLAQVNHVVYVKSDWRSYRARFLLDSPVEEKPTLSREYFNELEQSYNEVFSRRLNGIRIQEIDGGISSGINADEISAAPILRDNWETAHESSISIIQTIFAGMIKDHVEEIASILATSIRDEEINSLRDSDITTFVNRVFHGTMEADGGSTTLEFIDRNRVEKDPKYVQLIAGAYIKRDNQLLILTHAQTEKREELRGKRTILITGHVEKIDVYLTSGAKNAVENCLFRELKEELTNIDWPKVIPKFALRKGRDEMGRRHLAFIYEIQSISQSIGVSGLPGAGDFNPELEFWNVEDAKKSITEFDEWSQQIIEWLAGASN